MDWTEYRKRRTQGPPAFERVALCADRALVSELEDARAHPDPKRARTVRELEEAVAEATMIVTVRELLAEDYLALKEDHRPTDEEKRKKGHQWDEATFAPALLAATIDPPLTPEEAAEWWHGWEEEDPESGESSRFGWTAAERGQLFMAAVRLNETNPDLGFIRPGTERTNGIGQPLTTASPEE